MKRIGFLSFGHWTPAPQVGVRTPADALLQSIELAVAAEELGLDGMSSIGQTRSAVRIHSGDSTQAHAIEGAMRWFTDQIRRKR